MNRSALQSDSHRPEGVPTDSADNLSLAEIDAKMAQVGFPELRFLWDRFKKLKVNLQDIDPAALERTRRRHLGGLVSHPRLTAILLCMAVLLLTVIQPGRILLEGLLNLGDRGRFLSITNPFAIGTAQFVENVLVSLFAVVLFCFVAVVVQRTWIHSWHRISALDLANMLKRRSYRHWFDSGEKSRQVTQRLRELGINDSWDDPNYGKRYRSTERGIEEVPIEPPHLLIQNTLREILGHKAERQFQPGRFVDSLKEGKAGVTRFIATYQQQIQANKLGDLSLSEGIRILQDLKETYLDPGSPGSRCVEQALDTLQHPDLLPEGVVEARIWPRDPWVDLTSQTDFYSSASLRECTLKDAIERRTKGALGPFGYLRNKSITALDFITRDGRRVRARMAAATHPSPSGQRAVLFVDGVEGRFDIKPRLIKQAIEDYANAAGFEAVFYFRHPLNKVPQRFVRFVASTASTPEKLLIEYIDHSERQYLDAFGYPFEPLEYAFPKGNVMGYFVSLDGAVDRLSSTPGRCALWLNQARKKYILHAFAAVPLLFVIWKGGSTEPWGLLPLGLVVAALFAYQSYLDRRSTRTVVAHSSHPRRETSNDGPEEEPFLAKIRAEIAAHPTAVKMSYPQRLDGKIQKLREFFPVLFPGLGPFCEEILCNVSVKEGDMTNVLKFLAHIKDAEQREKARQVFLLVWPRPNPGAMRDGLAEDKALRDKNKGELFEKIDAIRELAKAADLRHLQLAEIEKMQRALNMDILAVIRMVTISPLILRGLRKSPRPLYACILPVALGLVAGSATLLVYPAVSAWMLYALVMAIAAGGTYFISTKLKIAPGILYYSETRNFLTQVMLGNRAKSHIEVTMETFGVNVAEYTKDRSYENKQQGTRIVVRSKKSLEGAIRFLTSSETIDSCIALQNFVSWTLPSLLNDDGIMLADIFHKGSHPKHYHRAQMWMVAAEEDGAVVLTVNSLEFNEEGAKYMDLLLPEAIKVLQDVAAEAGFRKIYVGITEFGRAYLDRHYAQGISKNPIKKIHSSEAGYRYYFDAYALKRSLHRGCIEREYVLAKQRGSVKRAYAVIFGVIELLKGNRAKAQAFFESFANANNFWEIPLESRGKNAPQSEEVGDISPPDV